MVGRMRVGLERWKLYFYESLFSHHEQAHLEISDTIEGIPILQMLPENLQNPDELLVILRPHPV